MTAPSARARVRPLAGVSICVCRDDRVLLVKRAKQAGFGLWSLPGGLVEPGEEVRDAALRELDEETGVSARIDRLLDCIDIIHRDASGTLTAHYILSVFLGTWVSGEAAAATDVSDVQWANADDVRRLDMTPGTADLLLHAVFGRRASA